MLSSFFGVFFEGISYVQYFSSDLSDFFINLTGVQKVFLIVALVISIAVWIAIAIGFANIAKAKGRNFVFFLVLCLLGGIPAYLYAWAVPQKEVSLVIE